MSTTTESASALTGSCRSRPGGGASLNVPVGVVLLNDSDVEASAGAGSGGNISIVANGYLQSGDSVVDASSEKSIDGEISIRAPANDITTEVAALPVELLDTAALVASACSSTQGADASFQVQRRLRPALPPDMVTGLDVMRLSDPCANRENLQ